MTKTTTLACLTAALFLGTTAAQAQNFNVSIIGGNVFEEAVHGHQHIGPAVFAGVSDSDSDSGVYGAVGMRYGWNNQFIGFQYQLIKVETGSPFLSPAQPPELGIDGDIFDIDYGRNFSLGSGTANWSIGIRHATIDFEGDNFGPGSGPKHAFEGTGARIGLETDMPLAGGNWSWFTKSGLSFLEGDINTTPRGFWICTDCTNTSTTAFGVDAKAGVSRKLGAANLMFGYHVQYWQDVNVEISDATNFGGNTGKSDLLVHGAFAGLNFDF